MNTFGDDAVIAYYRAEFTTDAAYTQTAAIQDALVEIQKDLVNATIAGYNTSDEYLNDVMAKDINTSESVFLIVCCNKRGHDTRSENSSNFKFRFQTLTK
jgi:hypothetical protein